jgi:hypothetical protein
VSRLARRHAAVVLGSVAVLAAGCGSRSKSSAAAPPTPSTARTVAASWHTNPPPTWTSTAFCARVSAGLRGLSRVLDQPSDSQIPNIQAVRYELKLTTPAPSDADAYSKSLADLNKYIHDLPTAKATVQEANTAYDALRGVGSTAGCH